VLDSGNRRIAVYDIEMKGKSIYYKTKEIGYLTDIFYMNGMFYFPMMFNMNPDKNKNRIIPIKLNGKLKKSKRFFNYFPDYYIKGKKNKMQMALFMGYLRLQVDTSEERKEIVTTFYYPGKQMVLYYYNHKGKFIKRQSFEIIKNYEFPKFLLKYPRKYPNRYTLIGTYSIHYYKSKYIILEYGISKVKRVNDKNKSENAAYIVVIDIEKGKIIDKKKVPSEFAILKVKGEYLYAKNFDDDIEKLHIYKIEDIK
jgi:hypothetical protein